MVTISDLGTYTFTAMLENTLAKFSDRPALGFASGEPITYAEFGQRISSMKDLLYRIGVEKGDRVALFSHSAPNWGVACFSTITLGAISVPLLPDFNAKEVQACLEHSGAKVLIVSKKLLEKIPDPASLGIQHVITISDLTLVVGEEIRSGSAPAVEIAEEDTASIIYTSGTTGRSKGVELSHRNFVFTAIACQSFQRVNKYDVALSFLPLSHVYEFTIGFLLFILNGACIMYLEKPPAVTTLLPAMKKVRPTLILSVPIIMEKIYKNKIVPTFTSKESVAKLYAKPFVRKILHRIAGKSLKKTFGGRLKFFGIGGAKIDPVVEQFLKEARFPYAIGYGLTETSPLLAGSGTKITVPGTVGPKMPGVELKILDPDPDSGIGEVVAKGLNVMKGYYKDPELTAAVFTSDGWFRTGDLGLIDKKGRLSLKGRSKNLILNAAGENIYPEDIEFVLNQHPFVTDSLVVEGDNSSLVALVQIDEAKVTAEAEKQASLSMMEHASRMKDQVGEAVASAASDMSQALVYKKEELMNEIKFFVNENVNRISRIDRVESVEQFEKTASQKIKRYLYNIKKTLHIGKTEE